jgi:hypothetical protein
MILLPKPSQNLPHVSLLELNQAFWIVGFLECFTNVKSSWCREQRERRLIWPYHMFPVVWYPNFLVVSPSFMHLSITFSNQRFSKLQSCGCWICEAHIRQFLWKRPSCWIFSSAVTYAAVVVWFFKTILLHVRQSLSVNVDFHSLLLFADVFPWFVYADITLETVTLDTPNVALSVTDAAAIQPPMICPFKIRQV